MRQVWPLALMLCADRVQTNSRTLKRCVDPSGFSRSPERPYLHYASCPGQLVLPIYLLANLCRQQQFRLLVSLALDHDGPGHPRNLVGERYGSHLGRPTIHHSGEPRPLLRPVLARVTDNGHGAYDQQPPQISIALLGDAAEPVFAAGSMLLRHQPDPGRKTAPPTKRCVIFPQKMDRVKLLLAPSRSG